MSVRRSARQNGAPSTPVANPGLNPADSGSSPRAGPSSPSPTPSTSTPLNLTITIGVPDSEIPTPPPDPEDGDETLFQKDRFTQIVWYCEERQRITIKKIRSDPRPWTDDEILQKESFGCVRREDDKTSRLLRTRIFGEYDPYKYDTFLWNVMVHRQFSRGDVSEGIKYIHNEGDMLDLMYSLLCWTSEGKSWRPGFIASYSNENFELWKEGKPKPTTRELFKHVKELKLCGDFHSYQTTNDMLMCGYATLDWDFAWLGPGARKCIQWVMGGDLSRTIKDLRANNTKRKTDRPRTGNARRGEEYCGLLTRCQKTSSGERGKGYHNIRPLDMENTLCIFNYYLQFQLSRKYVDEEGKGSKRKEKQWKGKNVANKATRDKERDRRNLEETDEELEFKIRRREHAETEEELEFVRNVVTWIWVAKGKKEGPTVKNRVVKKKGVKKEVGRKKEMKKDVGRKKDVKKEVGKNGDGKEEFEDVYNTSDLSEVTNSDEDSNDIEEEEEAEMAMRLGIAGASRFRDRTELGLRDVKSKNYNESVGFDDNDDKEDEIPLKIPPKRKWEEQQTTADSTTLPPARAEHILSVSDFPTRTNRRSQCPPFIVGLHRSFIDMLPTTADVPFTFAILDVTPDENVSSGPSGNVVKAEA
ncbi:hypothetical protein HK097_008238 [Rhizophlyctis rosea]|uniref:5-hmdU DNA kinase helical domain-containing protein n=1 Tax=Rhizophlyctis rosea TaxID=64517 RepID=A0AAD5X1T8_9FUNG|nr:hypothetical protein HK097_008238 [Rhizophlyctis rosea]